MKQIQFIGVTPTDLLNEIDRRFATLKKELSKEFQPKEPAELLTRDEVLYAKNRPLDPPQMDKKRSILLLSN